jgi:coproporphyrinogen III oxidase-like Fe-S oxidoreductase
MPGEGLAADLFEATQEICGAAGLEGYEISNHARPGSESRHNLIYWRYGDYVGVGPGAHGRLSAGGARWATETILGPEAWLDAVERGGSGLRSIEAVAPAEQAVEMLMMGLRLREGVDLARYAALAGRALDAQALERLEAIGLVALRGLRLAVTDAGRPVLNAVLKELLVA